MYLNTIKPAKGSKKSPKKLGRGIGSGLGKTCGKGHKGQKARAGGYHKVGFEGGQMPLQRRLPKVGFISQTAALSVEVRLHELEKVTEGSVVTLETLKLANVIPANALKAKIIFSGKITKAVTVEGLKVTPKALEAIQAAGGKVVALVAA
jgi:large subunit ribosomal protein L15